MKIKKLLFLSLFLVIGLLLFIPNTINAASIDEVTIDFAGAVPVVGKAPIDIVINSEKYEIVNQGWYEYKNGQVTDNKVTTFEYGKSYYFDMYIKAKDGYTFVSPVITTKNINWDNDYDRGIVTNPDNKYYNCVFIQGTYTTGTINENVEIVGHKDIIPIIGKTPQYLMIILEEYEIEFQEWYDENLNKVTTFEEGKTYFYIISLRHKTAHGWDNQSSLEIENIDWISTYSWSEIGDGTLNFAGSLKSAQGYEITVETSEGVIIGQDGSMIVPKGGNRTLQILAEEGYKITSVKVNGKEQTLPLENDELTFNNIQEDINVVVEAEVEEKSELKQINLFDESINQEFIKGTDENLTFILNNNGGRGKVFVDGVELNETNGDYSWRFLEALPYITISEDYLKTLKAGKHTIKFVIDNVGEAQTTFTIVGQEDKENNDDKVSSDEKEKDNDKVDATEDTTKNNSNNPQTGDNIMLYVAILGIAIIGIVVTTIARKKSQNN